MTIAARSPLLRGRAVRLALAAALTATGLVPALTHAATSLKATVSCPWMNRHHSPDQRAHALVAAMTLDQEIAELYGRGSSSPYGAANHIPAIPSLCIPQLVFNDAGAGVGDAKVMTTAFPDGITQAASWDRALQRRVGAAIGWEAWHKGVNVQLAPGINIARNPLAGRNFEYAGEDPYLSGQTGVAVIEGVQSQHVAATVKHYALNDQETHRKANSSEADERTMQEIHLPAFEAAVRQAHVAAVMCSYNRVNGVHGCQNRYLLRQVLKGQFGFKGWVMSDWGATHSTVRAARNGLDQEQDLERGRYFSAALKRAVLDGKVPRHRVDNMVFRLMRSLFAVGVFDHPVPTDPRATGTNVNTPREKAVARQAAESGAVLLKNTHALLPVRGTRKRLAIIGSAAGAIGAQSVYQGGGSSKVPTVGPNPNVVAPIDGITARAAKDHDVVAYVDGRTIADAVAVAKAADVAIVFVGDGSSEGVDRQSLDAHNQTCTPAGCLQRGSVAQNELVARVAAANPNTVVVLQTGAPVSMPWLHQVRSVLEMWYPGEQDGHAAAALLFGDVNPSGKLPYTFPKRMADTPIQSVAQWPGTRGPTGYLQSRYSEKLLVGYRWYDARHIAPLFPFGFGLSYTSFRYDDLRVTPTASGAVVRFAVTNTGVRTGAEVAQLYLSSPAAAHEPPKQLKGYDKVVLRPGQTETVTITLDRRAFSYWSTATHSWRVASGCYPVRVGGSSRSLPLQAAVARGQARC